MEDTFDSVVDKLLAKKLPKLVKTAATKRLLFLERRHFNFPPEAMCSAVEQRRSRFVDFALVDEVWLVENLEIAPNYIRFDRCAKEGDPSFSYDFHQGKLLTRVEGGFPDVVNRIEP